MANNLFLELHGAVDSSPDLDLDLVDLEHSALLTSSWKHERLEDGMMDDA
jgi:hypothetical protein